MALFAHLALAHDDQVDPLLVLEVLGHCLGPCTLPVRRGLALIFATLPRPTRRRRFDRQQSA